jgi:flavin-dependent dehydrogenase
VNCDIAVVGGGPAGACAALKAAEAGARVLLLHAEVHPRRFVIERLAPHATRMLATLALANDPCACAARECPGVRSLWGGGGVHTARSIFDVYGSGWVVQRTRFDRWLRAQARARGAQVLEACVSAITRRRQGWRVQAQVSERRTVSVDATQIVLAIGRSRRLLREVESDTRCVSREVAVLARLSGVAPAWVDDPLLLIESIESGWGYGLTAAHGQALVAFVLPFGEPAARSARTPSALWRNAFLESSMLREAAGSACVETVWAQACPVTHAIRTAGPGWAVAGDAACAHSPLSGLGVSFAIESGCRAAEALVCAHRNAAPLHAYIEWMQQATEEHLATKAALDGR